MIIKISSIGSDYDRAHSTGYIVKAAGERFYPEGIGNNLNQQTIIIRQHHGNAPHVDEMKRSVVQVMNAISERLKGGDSEDGGSEDHQPADR